MPPKKGKKIALSEFLGDGSLGSWADEVDALPSAPAPKLEGDIGRDDRFSRRDDSRGDRPAFAREEVPLPTQPPYTAFIGNLAFDLSDADIANHFSDFKINTVKIIKDRDDRPKGFGYVEFESLDGLKDALSKSGTSIAGRTIRVSVADPPKERSGFSGGGGHDDDGKFDNPWRRDGPLPDLGRGDNRRRFDGPPTERAPAVSDSVSEWRSSRPRAPPPGPEPDAGGYRRRGSGFPPTESASDDKETWTMGSRFKTSSGDEPGSRQGGFRARGDGPPKENHADEGDWRTAARPSKVLSRGSGGGSPIDSVPSTPQMGRRKLELLPRSGNASTSQTPLSSPKMASAQASGPKPNPFGAAKPVDVTQKEKAIEEKLEKEKERLPISRTNSRPAIERTAANRATSPTPATKTSAAPPKAANAGANLAPTVRPTLSFASAAAAKKAAAEEAQESGSQDTKTVE